jgi:hypothetical protein
MADDSAELTYARVAMEKKAAPTIDKTRILLIEPLISRRRPI